MRSVENQDEWIGGNKTRDYLDRRKWRMHEMAGKGITYPRLHTIGLIFTCYYIVINKK